MICRSTLRAWGFRMLAVVLAGVTGYLIADQAGPMLLAREPELWMYALAVAVPAILTFFTARSLAIFTDSCLGIPTPGAALGLKGGNGCANENCSRHVPGSGKKPDAVRGGKPAAKPAKSPVAKASQVRLPTFAKPAAAAPAVTVPDTYGVLVQNAKVLVETAEPGDDGLVTVTVTTTGLSNSQLKGNAKGNKKSSGGLLNQLHNVAGVRWASHKSVAEGKKQIVGKVSPDKRKAAFVQLIELANRYKS